MSTFTCLCGSVTRDDAEPPGTTCVMYSRATLHAIETRIADRVAEFVTVRDAPAQNSWLAAYFGPDYPTGQAMREVVEDIVMRELNGDFIGVFRCPACRRVAIKAHVSDDWDFYHPEFA